MALDDGKFDPGPINALKKNPKTSTVAAILGVVAAVGMTGAVPPPYGAAMTGGSVLIATLVGMLYARDPDKS